MHARSRVAGLVPAWGIALALVGCGKAPPPAATASSDYAPSTGTFARIGALEHGAAAVDTCNLDAVDDKPVGSVPVPHESVATFSGWAADGSANTVPPGVQLVLKGAQNYAINVAVGAPRPDVAEASKRPGWTNSGYVVKANLSAVAPGTYTPVLLFSAGGRPVQCATKHPLVIQ